MSFSRSKYLKKILIGTKVDFTLFLKYIQKESVKIIETSLPYSNPFEIQKSRQNLSFMTSIIIISHTCLAMLKWDQKRMGFATVFYKFLDHFRSIGRINKALI